VKPEVRGKGKEISERNSSKRAANEPLRAEKIRKAWEGKKGDEKAFKRNYGG